ncbi:MAG: hypothetical protein CMJ83_02890 [Planctomycetes bacterium]|nr:hypothetical protein [Planctomycetota bacterium]
MTQDTLTKRQTEQADAGADAAEADVASSSELTKIAAVVAFLRNEWILIGAGTATAVLLWVGLGSSLTDAEPEPGPASTQPEVVTPTEPKPAAPTNLGASEYLDLGRAAMEDGRFSEAQRLLGDGLIAAEPRQRRLRADLCRAMAKACHHLGQMSAAALYRDQVAKHLSGLSDKGLAIFDLAAEDLQAGRARAARRRLHLIALGGGQMDAPEPELVLEAQRRLAQSFEVEFQTQLNGRALDALPEPVLFQGAGW